MDTNIKVEATLGKNYEVQNKARNHVIHAGEPEDVGGSNNAAKPSELLLSSLASCKLITIDMYAQRKGWDVHPLSISLEILDKGDYVLIEKKINFPDHLTTEQKERLTIISGRCPVAKMLSKSIEYKIL